MLFAGTQMRFGEAAISIGKRRMGISVTDISVGEAPMAVAVTAMRIGTREKKMEVGGRDPGGRATSSPKSWFCCAGGSAGVTFSSDCRRYSSTSAAT
jgi:hypothetical protein